MEPYTQPIFTLDARDNIMLEVMRDHFKLDSNVMHREIQGMHFEVIKALEKKGIRYADLKSALVPATDRHEAGFIFDSREVASSWYGRDIPEQTTVSIGLCLVGQGCFLTDNEVRERATKASAHAKEPEKDKPRKNCIGTYRGNRFRSEDLYVAAPA